MTATMTTALGKRRCDHCSKFNPTTEFECNWCGKPTRKGKGRPAAPPTPARKPVKPAPTPAPVVKAKKGKGKKNSHSVCVDCPGVASLTLHRREDMVPNENGRLRCRKCDRRLSADATPEEKMGTWFVLQVEPGSEAQVRKDVMKQVRVRNLHGQIRRLLSPSAFAERVGNRVGDVLADGFDAGDNGRPRWEEAKAAGHAAAAAIYAKREGLAVEDVLDLDGFPGLRVQCFPGKSAGVVGWKVREYFELETVRQVITVRKFPGYMLVNMDYNEETAHVLKSTRNAWGLLLQPVHTGHLIKVTERKSQFATPGQELGYNWRVTTSDGQTVVAKGKAASRGQAFGLAEAAKMKIEAFKPTAVKDQEAAELLIAQKAVNQIKKDKDEKDKAVVNLHVGDRVRVRNGAFRDCKGEVVKINRDPKDKTRVTVDCTLTIMDRAVPLTVNHFDLERLTRGDR